MCFLLHKTCAAFRLCVCLFGTARIASCVAPSSYVWTLGLSGNYPDGKNRQPPVHPCPHAKTCAYGANSLILHARSRDCKKYFRNPTCFFFESHRWNRRILATGANGSIFASVSPNSFVFRWIWRFRSVPQRFSNFKEILKSNTSKNPRTGLCSAHGFCVSSILKYALFSLHAFCA